MKTLACKSIKFMTIEKYEDSLWKELENNPLNLSKAYELIKWYKYKEIFGRFE